MPSTLTTEPLGPRSVDEMLGVVHGRAQRMRRRRAMQRVGGAAAAMALALGVVVSLGNGTDQAHVRVVDDRGRQDDAPPSDEHPAADAPPPADGEAGGPGSGSGDAAPRPSAPSPGAEAPAGANPDQGVPALPAAQRPPPLELWASASDRTNDANPDDWYFDVVWAHMKFDRSRGMVVFTTQYRLPDAPLDEQRAARTLESDFDYGSHTYVVTVSEAGNRLGGVTVEGGADCGTCSADFHEADATLVVTVPVDVLNREIARHDDSEPLGAGADIAKLVAITTTSEGRLLPQQADVSEEGTF